MTTVPAKEYCGGILYGEGRIRVFCKEGEPAQIIKYNEPSLANLLEHMAPPPHDSPFASCLWQIVAEADPNKMEALIKQLAVALRTANKNRRANDIPRIDRRRIPLLRPDDQVELKKMIAAKEVSDRVSKTQVFLEDVRLLFEELNRAPTLAEIRRLKRPDWTVSEVSRMAASAGLGWLPRRPSTLRAGAM